MLSHSIKNKCLGKRGFDTIMIAEYALSTMPVRPSEIMEIYKCKHCKKYHIGHKPGTKNENFKQFKEKKKKGQTKKQIKDSLEETHWQEKKSKK